MANSPISGLGALTGANAATGDLVPVVDVSDTTQGAGGTTKNMTLDELVAALQRLRPPRAGSLHLPSGATAATFDRGSSATAAQSILTSGVPFWSAIDLYAGEVINTISFRTGATAAGTPTHQFFGIADSSRAVQRWTNDDTTTAWGATSNKTLSLTSAYTVPTTGLYYVVILVTATTMPNIVCVTANTNINSISPVTNGPSSDTGLTTPPTLPFTGGALTITANTPYAWVA